MGIRAETLLSLSKHIKEARGINQIQEGTVEVIITSICMFRDNLSKVWGFWWVFLGLFVVGFFLMGVFLKMQEYSFSFLNARPELFTVEGSLHDQCWKH